MSVKVAINGFGRIGRLAFRQMFAPRKLSSVWLSVDCDLFAVNDD